MTKVPPALPLTMRLHRLPLLLLSAASAATASTKEPAAAVSNRLVLDTPSYSVVIEERCPGEGEVGCHNVTYTGRSKRSGNHITLQGTTWHTYPDGVTPSRYLGHVFKNGSTTYFVHLEGRLEVRQGSQTLVNEAGTWKEGR